MDTGAGKENSVVEVAGAIVKCACSLLTLDLSGTVASITELLQKRISSRLEQRRIERFFDECTDMIAERLLRLVDHEFGLLRDETRGRMFDAHYTDATLRSKENERIAATLAVRDTLARGELSLRALVGADLDARAVENQLAGPAEDVLRTAGLGGAATQFYRRLLHESCAYLVEAVATFPEFEREALRELLRRDTYIIDALGRILDQLPKQQDSDVLEVDYRRLVVHKYDRMELFGITNVRETSRRYPLSVAYVSLGALRWNEERPRNNTTGQRVEEALAETRRVLLVGDAGSGKSTLLRWLAVRAASQDFAAPLERWKNCVPFLIPLRRYPDGSLPPARELAAELSKNFADDASGRWTVETFQNGRALVLIDGVDELRDGPPRDAARQWIGDLIHLYPDARYIVTSRTAAIQEHWLELEEFAPVELQAMSRSDVRAFVDQWHLAMEHKAQTDEELARIPQDKRSLVAAIESDRHLRSMAVNPLLCAMLCTLNREWEHRLPREKMDIYESALDMLLGRRDRVRGVDSTTEISARIQVLLLQDLAYWLVRNGWSDASRDQIVRRIEIAARSIPKVRDAPAAILRHFLERSGLLCEPAHDRVSFVHRTFQEYLAAKSAIENEQLGELVRNARDDQWRDIVVMASGHAQPRQANELIRELLNRYGEDERKRFVIPLALSCLQTARRLDPELRVEVEHLAREVIPPSDIPTAESLAAAGDFVVELISQRPPTTRRQAIACVRTAALVGIPAAQDLIAETVRRFPGALNEALRCWRYFEPMSYAEQVLKEGPVYLGVDDPSLIPALKYLRRLGRLAIKIPKWGSSVSVSLSVIPQLPNLDYLTMSCSFVELDLAPIADSPTIKDLDIIQGVDLRTLQRAPSSLERLVLDDWPYLINLNRLSGWSGLKSLTLKDCGCTNIDAISGLTNLESLTLIRVPARDLTPVRAISGLRRLRLEGYPRIDLAPLRGKEDLDVHVSNSTSIVNEMSLGRRSRILRFSDLEWQRRPFRPDDPTRHE